ncbi:MAG: hypothetical protein OXC26_22500 [Albidovulum sp.]|nr:hypothetical protein [Albidovulum sp.]
MSDRDDVSDQKHEVDYDEVLSRSYQPTKADMERDVSVSVSPERLADAVLKGGAPRRES